MLACIGAGTLYPSPLKFMTDSGPFVILVERLYIGYLPTFSQSPRVSYEDNGNAKYLPGKQSQPHVSQFLLIDQFSYVTKLFVEKLQSQELGIPGLTYDGQVKGGGPRGPASISHTGMSPWG